MNTRKQLVLAALLGQLVGPLGYLEPLFIPLVLAGPVVLGALAAARGLMWSVPVVLWLSAGLNMAWMDWLLFREDVAFHLALAVVMALLTAAGWAAVALAQRFRSPSSV